MRLQQITATPHPAGNRIILRWYNPAPVQYPQVQVIRRRDSYPNSPADGTQVSNVVIDEEGWGTADDRGREDQGLEGETVYYYTLFPYQNNPSEAQFDPENCAAAMATAPYGMAGQMYDLLPGIYHRYDTTTVPKTTGPTPPSAQLSEEDRLKGQLHRFLELPGGQLDQLYSFATALLNAYNLDQTDGRLLPLLAEWIGWQTDYRIPISQQRNEIRYAPYLYQGMGLIPTLEATVKRFLGWESQTKEFGHNVFHSNSPERLNLWWRQQKADGQWPQTAALLSLNFAYEGRLAGVKGQDGKLWLFYHTRRHDRWEIWHKTYTAGEGWTPSQPFCQDRRSSIEKYPTVTVQGKQIWVFWNSYDEPARRWFIHCRIHTDKGWSEVYPSERNPNLSLPWSSSENASRRQPFAVTDTEDGLWLFWLESVQGRQRLHYSRYQNGNWAPDSRVFPLHDGQDTQACDDVFVLAHPTETLWVFWARRVPTGGVQYQTRWQIAYRVKASLDPTETGDWGEVYELDWSELGDDRIANDREPFARFQKDEKTIELFWSSTRGGSWSIWQSTLDADNQSWTKPEAITTGPYSQRNPLVLDIPDPANPGSIGLIYRSNQSLTYSSQLYESTETTDFRYSGSTTVDTQNLMKLSLREQFDDLQTYTPVVTPRGKPKTPEDWYAWYIRCDTVGLYLTPTTAHPGLLQQEIDRLKNVLPQFLPIQQRVEFFLQPLEVEEIYDTIQEVTEQPEDEGILDDGTETYDQDVVDKGSDAMLGWQIFRTNNLTHKTVDFEDEPVETYSRTWHSGLGYNS